MTRTIRLSMTLTLALGYLVFQSVSCRREEKFQSLDDKIASPIDVAASADGQYFFVLNVDYPRDYNQGSIITVDRDGNKVSTVATQRLGRSLTVAGNDLIATFAFQGEDGDAAIELYDISNPKAPVKKASFTPPNCDPTNAVAKSGYKYFAVSCSNGSLIIGEFATNRSDSQIHLVRRYPYARRAMYLDATRGLLFAFPTIAPSTSASLNVTDVQLTDATTSSDVTDAKTGIVIDSKKVDGSNDIPDTYEEAIYDRKNKYKRGPFQYVVYDLETEAAGGFTYVEDLDKLQTELRWIYFSLYNFDGSPDVIQTVNEINNKYYRTNFWSAKPDPSDTNVFYLSHRGNGDSNHSGSPHANNVVKVTITANPKTQNGVAPKTEDYLSFERVYGFKGEGFADTTKHYPGDIEVAAVSGTTMLMVNNFRDPVNFPTSAFSGLFSKILGNNTWYSELNEPDTGHSYYQVALTSSGRALAVSFYQNILILLDVAPNVSIKELKTIN
jgi:hypothetical protein